MELQALNNTNMTTILLIITLSAVILFIVIKKIQEHLYNTKIDKVSFKESLDLCDLPIITFLCGNTKLNFLLDTGSTHSHISSAVVKHITTKEKIKLDTSIKTIGFDATEETQDSTILVLKYKDKDFPIQVFISEAIAKSFEYIKKESGVQLHGVLGNDFFTMYNYTIDFKKCVTYAQ